MDVENEIDVFWYVFNPSGFRPRYKHTTVESAIAESRRLAEANPGQKFEVLRCIGFSHVKPKPDILKPAKANIDDEIPF